MREIVHLACQHEIFPIQNTLHILLRGLLVGSAGGGRVPCHSPLHDPRGKRVVHGQERPVEEPKQIADMVRVGVRVLVDPDDSRLGKVLPHALPRPEVDLVLEERLERAVEQLESLAALLRVPARRVVVPHGLDDAVGLEGKVARRVDEKRVCDGEKVEADVDNDVGRGLDLDDKGDCGIRPCVSALVGTLSGPRGEGDDLDQHPLGVLQLVPRRAHVVEIHMIAPDPEDAVVDAHPGLKGHVGPAGIGSRQRAHLDNVGSIGATLSGLPVGGGIHDLGDEGGVELECPRRLDPHKVRDVACIHRRHDKLGYRDLVKQRRRMPHVFRSQIQREPGVRVRVKVQQRQPARRHSLRPDRPVDVRKHVVVVVHNVRRNRPFLPLVCVWKSLHLHRLEL